MQVFPPDEGGAEDLLGAAALVDFAQAAEGVGAAAQGHEGVALPAFQFLVAVDLVGEDVAGGVHAQAAGGGGVGDDQPAPGVLDAAEGVGAFAALVLLDAAGEGGRGIDEGIEPHQLPGIAQFLGGLADDERAGVVVDDVADQVVEAFGLDGLDPGDDGDDFGAGVGGEGFHDRPRGRVAVGFPAAGLLAGFFDQYAVGIGPFPDGEAVGEVPAGGPAPQPGLPGLALGAGGGRAGGRGGLGGRRGGGTGGGAGGAHGWGVGSAGGGVRVAAPRLDGADGTAAGFGLAPAGGGAGVFARVVEGVARAPAVGGAVDA